MAANKSFGTPPIKSSRVNIKERQEKLNYRNSHVTNCAKEKHNPVDEDTLNIPEILCQCQQNCTERVTSPLIQILSMYFFGMKNDRQRQNKYLSSLMISKEKKIIVSDAAQPGKRLRKMSFRYFVPILTVDDIKTQMENQQVKENKAGVQNGDAISMKVNGRNETEEGEKVPRRDHIEVCLKAFVTVHLISEKRVNITRANCKLKNYIYCTKPFPANNISFTIPEDVATNKIVFIKPSVGENTSLAGPSDVSLAAAAWLSNQCQQKKPSYAINPKTLLPEGLVLPNSVTCMPVCTKPQYDLYRDATIVDNFFHNQLWKPEYTGGLHEN